MSVFKEYEMMFKLNAQMSGSYNAAFTKAQAQISAFQKEIESLGKSQANITSYQKQQKALEDTQKKYATLEQQLRNVRAEIEAQEKPTSELLNKELELQQRLDRTKDTISQKEQRLQKLADALKEAGVNTDDLGEASKQLDAKMDEVRKSQDEAAESAMKMGSFGAQAIFVYQQAFVASGIQNALESLYEELSACIDASIAFESALTGVDKTTDLSETELSEMSEAVKDLALEIPVTTDEMLGIGEVAGQLGVAKENLLDFSTTMSMLATSTTMAADEGATLLAQFANITQMDPAYYDELASAIVYLGNNYATTEQKITEMSQGIAASASIAGMSEADMIGISAAVTSLGHEAQMGSTAISRLIAILMTAVETGDGLTELANVAGMSAEEFSAAWGENAASALESFIVGLNDTSRMGQSAIVTLTELGITEARMQKVVLSLANSGDNLTQAIAAANKAWSENIALTDEAAKRYATTASMQVVFQNSINNLQIAVGDALTPTLRTLYSVGADVIAGVADFVEANPALVRAVTATIGIIGTVTAALAAYTVVAKLAEAATKLMTAAIPGLNVIMAVTTGVAVLTGVLVGAATATESEAAAFRKLTESSKNEYYQLRALNAEYQEVVSAQGESSEAAQDLAWQIDRLSASYETNKQTVDEYVAANEAARESSRAMLEANREAYEEININEARTLALVHRLEELASKTDDAVSTQEEMKAIISELNDVVPGLALSYEDVANGSTDYVAAIEAIAKAEADRQRYETNQQGMADAINAETDATNRLAAAKANQEAAAKQAKAAEADYWTVYNRMVGSENSAAGMFVYFTKEYRAYKDAKDNLEKYNEEVANEEQNLANAQNAYQEHLGVLTDYVEEQNEAGNVTQILNDRINETKAAMDALSEAYTEAYNAAYESVSGQYSLWDEAAKVVATSTDTITSNIDSQTEYWQGYNSNLQSLTERSSSIEGLSDMIASFADGSAESVNAIAGMASASDEELTTMVSDWQALQAEQKLVADSIAELSTNFSGEMDALQASLEEDIAAMDLSEEAAASGQATVQGYIDAAEEMLPQVQAAFKKIAEAALAALGLNFGGDGSGGGSGIPGFAGGTNSAPRGLAMVGENGPELVLFNGGEQVLNAAETAAAMANAAELQMLMFSPHLMAAMNAYSGTAVDAVSDPRSAPVSIQVTFQIQGDATPDVVEALDMYGNEFAERVLSIVEDAGADAVRRSY